MRSICALALLLALSVTANAAHATVIDFESVLVPTEGALFVEDTFDIDGYRFNNFGGSMIVESSGPSSTLDGVTLVSNDYRRVEFTNIAGQAFDLYSLDIGDTPNAGIEGDFFLSAVLQGGGTLDYSFQSDSLRGLQTIVLDWQGITSLTIRSEQLSTFDPDPGWRLDNIVVTAVPVPAAVWLFGSALAGLGWMRRKQTA